MWYEVSDRRGYACVGVYDVLEWWCVVRCDVSGVRFVVTCEV